MYIFKNKKGNKRFIDNIIYEGLDKGGEKMLTFLKKNHNLMLGNIKKVECAIIIS